MTSGNGWRAWLREPLVHFLGGALLIFGFFWITGADRDPADYQIEITNADVERLKAQWIRNFRRAPTEDELENLIDAEIREEIYYREALRLGLDRNDAVIRRRLFTKMRFLEDAEAGEETPSDEVLERWMADNPNRYRDPPRFDLEQIYLGADLPDDGDTDRDLASRLDDGEITADSLRKPLSLPQQVTAMPGDEIARRFGVTFADRLTQLETGQWAGPVRSGFGFHLVRISASQPGKLLQLDEARQQVTTDWMAAQREQRLNATDERLRANYEITIAGQR